MRIVHLISELNKCTELKKDTEIRLEASKLEKEALKKTFESCYSEQGEEKTNLKLKLSTDVMELEELTANISCSLEILADQISAWEAETALIRNTVNELLAHKIDLKKQMTKMETRLMLLTAEESRMENNCTMEELCFAKQKLKTDLTMILTFDRGCQTEEKALPRSTIRATTDDIDEPISKQFEEEVRKRLKK